MAKLNTKQIEDSKAWLYDIFTQSGLTGGKPTVRPHWYYNCWDWTYGGAPNATKTIYDAIKFRQVNYQNFVDIDNALGTLSSGTRFVPTLDPTQQNSKVVKKPAHILAAYIANFCANNNIYWDNTLATPFEMDEIKKTTIGNALWEYGCFTSQAKPTVKTTASKASTPRTPGQAPQNGYKSLGGLSSQVSILVGQPGQKIALSGNEVYCIEADKLGKNTPCIFVTPVTSSGSAVDAQKAKLVHIGSSNGYSDCKLWWNDLIAAQSFLVNCQNKFANGKFQNLHIAKARPDANGYYEVNTEFGSAYIKASKLNEEILEALCTEQLVKENKKTITSEAYVIQDIDTYSEAFDKYRD